MAAKPRRRRHNKHNLSFVFATLKNGDAQKVPRSRKAFKSFMRDDRKYMAHDRAIIKRALYGKEIGEMVYVPAEIPGSYRLNNSSFAGYYANNSKGVVRLTGELLTKALKARDAKKGEAHAS